MRSATFLRICAAALLAFSFASVSGRDTTGLFVRGDVNGDGKLDIADPILTLQYLFGTDAQLPCEDAADANDDGVLNIADAVFELSFLFTPGVVMPEPSGEPGPDPTPDELTCGEAPSEAVTLIYSPRQCESDPWEDPAIADRAEELRVWVEKQGGEVISVKVKNWDVPVCMACGCPRGYSLIITVRGDEAVGILLKAGFELVGDDPGPRPDPPPRPGPPPAIE